MFQSGNTRHPELQSRQPHSTPPHTPYCTHTHTHTHAHTHPNHQKTTKTTKNTNKHHIHKHPHTHTDNNHTHTDKNKAPQPPGKEHVWFAGGLQMQHREKTHRDMK